MWSTSALNACALQVVTGQTKPMSQSNNHSLLDKGHTKNRQRIDKGQDRIPCTWETSPVLCLPFVYSLSLLCLVKNNWRTVTHLLFSRSLSAKHMHSMHSYSACVADRRLPTHGSAKSCQNLICYLKFSIENQWS